jgi:hypothetical protein
MDDIQGCRRVKFSSDLVSSMIKKIGNENFSQSYQRRNFISNLETNLMQLHELEKSSTGFYFPGNLGELRFGGHALVQSNQGFVEISTHFYLEDIIYSSDEAEKMLLFVVDYYNGLVKYFS